MGLEEPIDIVVEIINTLGEKPTNLQDLTDKLWSELRSPVATTPIVSSAISFLTRKKLVYKRNGLLRLTLEGKKIYRKELPSPRHVSHYEQVLEAGQRRREEVIRSMMEEDFKKLHEDLKEARRIRITRRAKAIQEMGNVVNSI